MTDLESLARRAVACPRWKWMQGMRSLSGLRLLSRDPLTIGSSALPDFTDPATLGCLLALVREAWNRRVRAPEYWPADGGEPEYWAIGIPGEDICCDTEAEALVRALELAP